MGVGFWSTPSVSLYRHDRRGWPVMLDGLPEDVEGLSMVYSSPVLLASAVSIAENGIAELDRVAQLVENQGVETFLVHAVPNIRFDIVPRVHELGLEPIDVVIHEMDLL